MWGKKSTSVSLKTAPSFLATDLNPIKLICDISLDDSKDDALLIALMKAAQARFEQDTGRKLINQTWLAYYSDWPYADENDRIEIPYSPLVSVTSVKYFDSNNQQLTLNSNQYEVDIASQPGGIILAYSGSWPTANLRMANPIEIEFICGYGIKSEAVPSDIQMAIAMMVEEWFHNRSASDQLPEVSKGIINAYHIFSL